jgi:SAM-dependent methyltransferase
LSPIDGSSPTVLSGFSSRKFTGALSFSAEPERHWFYAIDWLRAKSSSLPSMEDDRRVLVVGDSLRGLPFHQDTVRSSVGIVFDAALFRAVVVSFALTDTCDLRSLAVTLDALQARSMYSQGRLIPMFICTIGTQPSGVARQCANAGLWGLARACRQEGVLPTSCIDLQRGLQDLSGLALALHGQMLQVAGGSVRGLQLATSFEPEAVLDRSGFVVPRLVAQNGVQLLPLPVDVGILFDYVRAHVVHASDSLDMVRLQLAYKQLEKLGQTYVRAAIKDLNQPAVPLWHHKLLLGWCSSQAEPTGEPIYPADVLQAHADLWPELRLMERCGSRLADALSAVVPYQELLFPAGSMEMVLPIYEQGVAAAFYNRCVVAAIQGVLSEIPDQHTVIVLEVGAGSGGTASSILPVVEKRCRKYVFTDVSSVFLRQARARFAEYRFLETALLNIDADPRLQGFALQEHDLLVSTNCLHATPFICNTLRNCHALLSKSGVLVVNEAVQNTSFNQITFGLTDGWWLFAEVGDPERRGQASPLLSWQQWASLLSDSGFEQRRCVQGDGFLRVQAVILAQRAPPQRERAILNPSLSQGVAFFTGGLGGLGLLAARSLVEAGARHLVLSSRSGRVVGGSENDWAWLAACEADVQRVCCDASDEGVLRSTVQRLHAKHLGVRSVFHAAHHLVDGILANQIAPNFAAV